MLLTQSVESPLNSPCTPGSLHLCFVKRSNDSCRMTNAHVSYVGLLSFLYVLNEYLHVLMSAGPRDRRKTKKAN